MAELNTDPARARRTLARYLLYVNVGFALFHFAMGVNTWIIIVVNILGAGLLWGMTKMEAQVEAFLSANPDSSASKVNKFAGKRNG